MAYAIAATFCSTVLFFAWMNLVMYLGHRAVEKQCAEFDAQHGAKGAWEKAGKSWTT